MNVAIATPTSSGCNGGLRGRDYIEFFSNIERELRGELRARSMREAFDRFILGIDKVPEYQVKYKKLESVRKVIETFEQSQLISLSFTKFWKSISKKDSAFFIFQEEVIRAQRDFYPTPEILKKLTEKAEVLVYDWEARVKIQLSSDQKALSNFKIQNSSSIFILSDQRQSREIEFKLREKLANLRLILNDLQITRTSDIQSVTQDFLDHRELEPSMRVDEIGFLLNRINEETPQEITDLLLMSNDPYSELVNLLSTPGIPHDQLDRTTKREGYYYSKAESILDSF